MRREDWSVICNAITHWLESLRTHNHILLSHLRLPQPGAPDPRIYIPQGTGWPCYTSEHWFPSCRLLRLAGLRWRYSNRPQVKVTLLPTISRPVRLGVRHPFGTRDRSLHFTLPHLSQLLGTDRTETPIPYSCVIRTTLKAPFLCCV
jgi:hypothetical protein